MNLSSCKYSMLGHVVLKLDVVVSCQSYNVVE
jgi:hypothetical protein